jgi:hypothetical protein
MYRHADAFRFVTYRADNRHTDEVIWNSRDGLVLNTVTLRDGSTATRRIWRVERSEQSEPCVPDHRPAFGDRIFIDLTVDRAIELAFWQAEKWWSGPPSAYIRERFASQGGLQAVMELLFVQEAMSGAPEVVVVTEEMARERGWALPV